MCIPFRLLLSVGILVSFMFAPDLNAQTQKGADIDGEAQNDISGHAVCMPDANTVAIGAPNNDGAGNLAGHVRVYEWNGTTWVQKGADLDGEAAEDQSGASISMPDANTVAISAQSNDGNGKDAGHVRVYQWVGGAWVQKGLDIDGETAGDSFGTSVSMPDVNTIAVGAYSNNDAGANAGQTRIFQWNGTAWLQMGNDIDGEAVEDYSGVAVCMPDAQTVAIGAERNRGGSTGAGHVRIFQWNGTAWVQKGADINGEKASDQSGSAVSMPDANTVAIGATGNDANGSNSGHVRIYHWISNAWVQKGADIDGEGADVSSGDAVSMPNAYTVAIGARYNVGGAANTGRVRLYQWDGSVWVQRGGDINGEAGGDNSGCAVSMPDANTIAIGAFANDGNGPHSGHVRVYTLDGITDVHKEYVDHLSEGILLYPNPSTGQQFIDLGVHYNDVQLTITDIFGNKVSEYTYTATRTIGFSLEGPPGMYLLLVRGDNILQTSRPVIKQ